MAAATATDVQKAYLAYFGRPADPVGLAYWTGKDTATMKAGFAASLEYATLYAGMTSTQMVSQVYTNLLGRSADVAGLLYWAGELAAGRQTVSSLVDSMQANALGADVTTINNRVTYATAFTAALDTSAEIVAYSGTAAADSARAAVLPVTTDASLTTATTALATTIATVTTAGTTTTGSTYTLTSGIDTFTGGSGNDTFIGDNVTTSAADQITGGSGTDTVKLYGNAPKPVLTGVEVVYLNGNTAGFDVSSNSDVTTLQLVDATTAQNYTITNGQAVSVATMAAAEVIDFVGNTVTALTVDVNALGTAAGANDVQMDFNSTAQTAVTFNAVTAASYVELLNTGAALATVNVTGDKALAISSALTTVKTIDANANTGGVNVAAVGASALTFTGGTGNDRINLGATLGTTDSIAGGSGTDTIALSGAADATLTATTGAKISGFEVLEIGETADNKAYNVDNLIGTNTFTGLTMTVTGTGATTTVNNINAGATGNITFTGDEPEAVLTAKDFVAGGTSDTATINLNNDTSDNANGVDLVALTFANADILNFVTTKSASQGLQQNSVALTATDVEKIVVTGNDSMLVQTTAGTVPTEIDGSGMTSTAVLSVDTDASAIASILVKGTANADAIDVDNAATVSTTMYTGGGSDDLKLDGAAGTVNTLKFTSTALNAGDVKAGNALTIALAAAADTSVLNFDMSSTLEGLLKNGGTVLGTSSANVTITGTALGATTNIAATNTNANPDTVVIQIDLDGDGAYVAANDWQATVTLTGNGNTGASTVVYNATTDMLVLTVA